MKSIIRNAFCIIFILPTLLFAQEENQKDNLFRSIRNGEIDQVKEVLNSDNSLVNSRNHLNSTPLIVAAFANQPDICHLLIEKNADVNLTNNRGNTAIHYASLFGQLDIVKSLVDKGAEVKVWNNRGRNPIHYSAYSGNIQLFEYLQSKGLDLSPSASDQSSVLHWACHGGNIDMVKYLMDKGFNLDLLDSDGNSVLHWASSGNSMEMIKFLVEEKEMDVKSTTPTGNTVMHSAAFGRNIEGIKYFLTKGFDINKKFENGQTVLILASDIGDTDFIKYLIENGADVNAMDNRGGTALNNAAFSGNLDVVKLLIENGANITPKICKKSACAETPTPLHIAAWRSPNVVKYLLDNGVDVNILSEEYSTALHEAIVSDSLRSIEILCDAGININQQDKNGMTALHDGIKRGKVDGVKLLLGYNPELDIQDITGKTALHYASVNGNKDLIKLLLKSKADLNTKDLQGNSALDLANYYGNKDAAKLLSAKGAKSYNKNDNMLEKDLALGESVIWYLDHSGYAIKTKNNFLIFDYWERQALPESGSLSNGYINPDEIKNFNVTVFVSHTHVDHFSQVIFDWNDKIKNINYVLGFDHNTDINYSFIPARETRKVGDVKITPVVSNDSGQGFYVEVDGATIFHPGDHTNISRDMCPNYTGDVKFLADKYKYTDIAFFPVTGCRFQDKIALNMGTEFALKNMRPVLALPMHGSNNEFEYKKIAEDLNKKFEKEIFKYPLNRGDRFYYKKLDSNVATK